MEDETRSCLPRKMCRYSGVTLEPLLVDNFRLILRQQFSQLPGISNKSDSPEESIGRKRFQRVAIWSIVIRYATRNKSNVETTGFDELIDQNLGLILRATFGGRKVAPLNYAELCFSFQLPKPNSLSTCYTCGAVICKRCRACGRCHCIVMPPERLISIFFAQPLFLPWWNPNHVSAVPTAIA